MARAKKEMIASLKLVDMVIELSDARIPYSSRNPDIDGLAAGKIRMIILNKADTAEEKITSKWLEYYKEKGIPALAIDSRNSGSKKKIMEAIMKAAEIKFERDRKKGILRRPVRVMVCGIPNVGKSTLINTIAGKASAKVGNKPGVTKGNQWIRLNEKVELLDTPGLLWPKFEDQTIGSNLAFIGSINDEILSRYDLSISLVERLKAYPGKINERYGVDESVPSADIIKAIGEAKLLLKKGGEVDEEKACRMLIDDFRSGKLGRISLESPDKGDSNVSEETGV